MKHLFQPYVPDSAIASSSNFTYLSENKSLLYKHLTGPLAQYLIWFCPKTISPNLITIIAFICSLIPHLLIQLYSFDNLDTELPAWVCLITGLGQFLYNTLDNMDGKQARRLKVSTALGMLYDHGLDTITGWVIALSFGAILRIGNTAFAFVILIFTSVVEFYVTFLE
jgi:ethanolaminephosphotransferase